MKKLKFTTFFVLLAAVLICFCATAQSDDVQELKNQIKALQERVQELESAQDKEDKMDKSQMGAFPAGSWDPFDEIGRMQAQMDQMFRHSFGSSSMNSGMFSNDMFYDNDFKLEEKDNQYIIVIDMTGLNQEKTNININKNSITISGEHSNEETQENPNGVFQTRSFGTFVKTIPLPTNADTGKARTEQKDDTLIITLPKK